MIYALHPFKAQTRRRACKLSFKTHRKSEGRLRAERAGLAMVKTWMRMCPSPPPGIRCWRKTGASSVAPTLEGSQPDWGRCPHVRPHVCPHVRGSTAFLPRGRQKFPQLPGHAQPCLNWIIQEEPSAGQYKKTSGAPPPQAVPAQAGNMQNRAVLRTRKKIASRPFG